MCCFSINLFSADDIQKHKKKKKDRVRDRDRDRDRYRVREREKDRHRDKDKSHKHRHHSPSQHSSSNSSNRHSITDKAKSKSSSTATTSSTPSKASAATPSKSAPTIGDTAIQLANESASVEMRTLQRLAPSNLSGCETTIGEVVIKESPTKTAADANQIDDRVPAESVIDTTVNTSSTNQPDMCNTNNHEATTEAIAATSAMANGSLPSGTEVKSVFVDTIKLSPLASARKPTEEVAGIIIKKDYLPSPAKITKIEKTRDDVTRVLNYDSDSKLIRPTDKPVTYNAIIKAEPEHSVPIKLEPDPDRMKSAEKEQTIRQHHHHDNKENTIIVKTEKDCAAKRLSDDLAMLKTPRKPASAAHSSSSTSDKRPSSSSKHSSHHRLSVGDSHHMKTPSSSSKSSSRRSSTSSGHRECSRCYKRSKIKRVSTGVQCRRATEVLEHMPPTTTPLKVTQINNVDVTQEQALFDFKYARFFHVEVHSNGGASVVHMYQKEIDTLTPNELEELVDEYFQLVFSEDENGYAHHVMGIIHDAAAYLPDLLEHMADNYSTLTIKAGVMGRNSDIETSTLAQYYEQVVKQYSQGTFRHGPLHQISLVGKVHEEVGGYFPDLLGRLEQSPFLNKVCTLRIN